MSTLGTTAQASSTAATPEQPLIAVEEVTAEFGEHRVLQDLSLAVRRGETLAVIGESGCGKTVLLKLVIGLLQPARGRVLFDGKVLSGLPERELAQERLRFGFLFQGAALFDSLSVFDNVAFGLRVHGKCPEPEVRERVRQRLQEVGLPTSAEEKMPVELSGGMKKRVGLARALALDPEVMLYDEPTTGLDPIMSDVINDLILQTRRQHHVTSMVVTHDLRTVEKVADRVIMLGPLARLRPGGRQVVFEGSVARLIDSEDERVREFIDGNTRQRRPEPDAG
jgi:phospholipid/cholesterol/gamma-HCH transport system ATP-binding protein